MEQHAEPQPAATGDAPTELLALQLRRLCSRQRLRAEERLFVRDVERALALLRQQQQQQHAPARSSSSGSELTAAELELLFECLTDLFAHRNAEVRAVALETATLCLSALGEQLGTARRRQVFALLLDAAAATNHPAGGDFALRQRMLRVLTHDGRHVEPFRVELGWLLLRLLEQSDEQRDLMALIQTILRRSPSGLDAETVIAIADVMCSRCDAAWGRGDVESCKKFLSFFHVLATHGLEHAASTAASLRTLCCMVNADGHGTWSIMKHLLNGSAGFQVLRGLVNLLESPHLSNQWVLRGAVFFIGMSCWGSQRVGKLEDIKWAPILLALERVLKCDNGVVIFEVILALQRLIKKFGAAKTDVDAKPAGAGGNCADKRLIVEWDIILRIFRELRPWLSLAEDVDSDDGDSYSSVPSMMTYPQFPLSGTSSSTHHHAPEHQQFSVSIHQTRIPRELLDTLSVVEDLVAQGKFAGEVEDFFDVLEDYLQHLHEGSTLFLLRHRAEAAHPAYHVNWLQNLSDVMLCFFTNGAMRGAVRLEALEVLRVSLHCSRNICEDRVVEDVLLPTLAHVFDDHHAEVRRRGVDLVTEVARLLESGKFDALLDILANAVTLALYEDAQVYAASGIVSLFSSCFDHMPHTRSLRMYELIARLVETHRNAEVRKIALTCLLHVCEADVDFRLQWKDAQVRTSRFLYVARNAVRNPQTGACVPVARGLRAMLTLVSTETHAELFRLAVSGIRVMLENRVVLTDVDISDMTLKIISSIDYRAFGRAAIPDELARLTEDEGKSDNATRDPAVSRANAWELLSRRNTESDILRYASHPQRSNSRHGEPGMFKSSLRDTLVVLCKTKFMTMGLELLALLTSYASELNRNARRHLISCLVGTLEMQLAVAEKDLFAGSSSSSEMLSKSRSAGDFVRDNKVVGGDFAVGAGSGAASSVSTAHHRSSHERSSGLQDRDRSSSYSASKPASPPHLGFTTRMLSRFHPSASHSNLFHHVSSASSSAAKPSAADLEARERLQRSLRSVYEAEFALLYQSTTVLSLLAVRAPDEVVADMELIVRSARVCFTTPDGDFRADGYGAMLEMLANIVYTLPTLSARCYEAVVEILLIGLEYAKSKQLSYLAFRLLCTVVVKCAPVDRVTLASVALPRLQQFQLRLNSLLIEAAIDFLMSFTFSKSFPLSPAILSGRADADEKAVVQSRSWVYKRSVLTIQVTKQGSAELVIRRASSTSRWDLHLLQDSVVDPNTVRAVMPEFDEQVEVAGDVGGVHLSTRCAECAFEGDPSADENDPNAANTRSGDVSEERQGAIDALRPEDETASSDGPSDAAMSTLAQASHCGQDDTSGKTTTKSDAPPPSEPAQALPPPVPISHDAVGENGTKKQKKSRAGSSARKQVSFELRGNSPTIFPSAALPPLPAYDGIGGSPSYFCEAHPGTPAAFALVWLSDVHVVTLSLFCLGCLAVRRRNPARVFNSAHSSAKKSASNGSSASPFDGQLQSPYDDNEDDEGPDDFSLDGSSAQPSVGDAGGRSQHPGGATAAPTSASTATTAPTTAGSATSEQTTAADSALDRREPTASSSPPAADDDAKTLDPMFLMMQLFDLTVENRPQLLTNGAALSLGLNVLDRTPGCETHKIGLLYVKSPEQRSEVDILRNSGGSLRYLKFLRGLGTFTKLQGLASYTGGLDCATNSDGEFGLLYKDACTQIMFHVATLMGPASSSSSSNNSSNSEAAAAASSDRALAMSKKRHIGNDFVHVVYKESDAEYDVATLSGQFNDVHIVVQPLNDREYRTHVRAKPGLKPFGPLHGTQVVSSAEVAACVRLTCLNANLACQTFHQDLVGFALNCEERLKQIKQLGIRLASRDEWQVGAP